MTDLADAKSLIQEEETDFRSAVSEALLSKTGQAINFINNRQLFYKEWNMNGDYRIGAGTKGFDGIFPILHNFEIVSMSISNIEAGSSGSTRLDVHLLRGSGVDMGTIFTIKPEIDSTAPDDAYGLVQFLPTVSVIVAGTGVTTPTLGVTNEFLAGDAFRVDVETVMTSAQNLNFMIGYRPR